MSAYEPRRAVLTCTATIAAALAFVTSASAQSHPVSASPYATGFPVSSEGVGPVGIALDTQNRLFALDSADGWLYRFDGPGGTASPAARLGSAPLSTKPGGLAFDDSGHLFAARIAEGDVVQIDPNTGAVIRTVASHLPCALGIAYDRTSGSLFLTSCPYVRRIASPMSANPAVSTFATDISTSDGIAVGPDGTIYVVEGPGHVDRVDGVGSANPGHVTQVDAVPGADGIAVGRDFLLVNRTDGIITRVDLSSNNAAPEDVFTGGTRGDFSAVGADGCLYATQTDEILRVTEPDGSCNDLGGVGGLASTTPARPQTGHDLPAVKGCIDTRGFTFHLHHGPRSTVVRVNVFVNGKRRIHARGKDIKTVTLKRLPKKKFRVRVVSIHSNGSTLISTRTYKGCKKTKPKTHRHSHK